MEIYSTGSTKKIILIRRRTCKLLLLGLFLIAFLLLVRSRYANPAVTFIRPDDIRQISISSTEFPYFTNDISEPLLKKKLYYKVNTAEKGSPSYDHYTIAFLYEEQQATVFHYSPTLNEIYCMNFNQIIPSPALKEVLLNVTASYRQEWYKIHGVLLVWEEVDKIFPMYAVARITDIYTSASFNVQRREGSSHVDAQPLTAEDTATMKQIYGGRWSWERKGIIVEVSGYRIAASMTGMPHGSGKIADNNFPGHFCIHFLNSTIHDGGIDIRHQREILKAAGKLPINDD